MSKAPLPGSCDPDEHVDDGRTAWDEALYCAERGDESLLITLLNGDTLLPGDDRHVRDFIVGRLTGKITRPRGRPRPRDDWTFVTDFDGKVITVRKKGRPWYNAAAFVRTSKKRHDKAVEAAAEKYELEPESLHKWLRSSKKERAKRFGLNPAR